MLINIILAYTVLLGDIGSNFFSAEKCHAYLQLSSFPHSDVYICKMNNWTDKVRMWIFQVKSGQVSTATEKQLIQVRKNIKLEI